MKRVMILTSEKTGNGHRQAANAIEKHLLPLGYEIKKVNCFIFDGNQTNVDVKSDVLSKDEKNNDSLPIDNSDKKELGASTLDIAKRLMDENIHPATIYFPLIVHEAFMVEPTESETKEVLDNFINTMIKIANEIKDGVDFHEFPKKTPISRADEVRAARQLDLKE